MNGVMVWSVQGRRWRHHPVTKGSFNIRGDTATWTYNDRTHMAPLNLVGSVKFSCKLPGKADLQHSNIREKEEGEVQLDDTDLARRWRVVVSCLTAAGLERATDGYGRELNRWQCPTHDDEHPSLSVNPDERTGNILFKCHSGGDECGNGDALSRTNWLRELARQLDCPISTFFPRRTRTTPDGYEAPF